MARVAIALGSNLGDRLRTLRRAVTALSDLGTVEAVSSLYQTEPVGGPPQDDYLNAVVVLETALSPRELLDRLKAVEQSAGRRRVERWGPRTLDLDIITFEATTVDNHDLQIPHPRAMERRFVLAPLADIWPAAPVGPGSTAAEAVTAVKDQRVYRWHGEWIGGDPDLGVVAKALVWAQVILLAGLGAAVAFTAGEPSAIRLGVGVAMMIGGAGWGIWATLALGQALTIFPQPRRHAGLVERGPYRHARHPIYGAILVLGMGACVVSGSWVGVAVVGVLSLLLWYKSRLEERALILLVPGYREYRNRVRHRFLPLVW